MKKIIIFLIILLSTFFSNVAFADIMVPWIEFEMWNNIYYVQSLIFFTIKIIVLIVTIIYIIKLIKKRKNNLLLKKQNEK